MAGECRIRVEGSRVRPFQYSTSFVLDGLSAAASPLESHFLYGDGDLAVFLEDLGLDAPMILLLLSRLTREGAAEVPVSVPREVLEVLSRHNRGARSREAGP
ncbi:MAG: hypothetical protein ACRD00_03340 [Thermoanaerobaculia bacterium]